MTHSGMNYKMPARIFSFHKLAHLTRIIVMTKNWIWLAENVSEVTEQLKHTFPSLIVNGSNFSSTCNMHAKEDCVLIIFSHDSSIHSRNTEGNSKVDVTWKVTFSPPILQEENLLNYSLWPGCELLKEVYTRMAGDSLFLNELLFN